MTESGELPLRNKNILLLRFGSTGNDMTLEEIGTKYQLTRERVRQIIDQTTKAAGK